MSIEWYESRVSRGPVSHRHRHTGYSRATSVRLNSGKAVPYLACSGLTAGPGLGQDGALVRFIPQPYSIQARGLGDDTKSAVGPVGRSPRPPDLDCLFFAARSQRAAGSAFGLGSTVVPRDTYLLTTSGQ